MKPKKKAEVSMNIVVSRELRKALKSRAALLDITVNALIVNILTFDVEKKAGQPQVNAMG